MTVGRLDPLNLAPRLAGGLRRGAPAAMELWLEATKWWAGSARVAADAAWVDVQGQILANLVDGLMGGFAGRAIEFDVDGRKARAILESVWLGRRGGRFEARLELRQVTWDGWEVQSLSIHAPSIELTSSLDTQLRASHVRAEGQASLAALARCLDERIAGWSFHSEEDGMLTVGRRGRRRTLHVEALVEEGRCRCELREIRWRGLRLGVPRWLRLTRSFALPTPPGQASVVDARARGGVVGFRATVPEVTRRLDLASLREAIRRELGSSTCL